MRLLRGLRLAAQRKDPQRESEIEEIHIHSQQMRSNAQAILQRPGGRHIGQASRARRLQKILMEQ